MKFKSAKGAAARRHLRRNSPRLFRWPLDTAPVLLVFLRSGVSRRKRTQAGSALIEFALSATLVVMLAVGSVSFGLAVQKGIIVADAASAGASFGANGTFWVTYTSGMQDVASAASTGVNNFTSSASYFCECTAGGSVVSCTSSCSSDQPLYYAKVSTSATFNNFFSYFGLPSTFTLQSTSVMPVQ